MKRASTIVELYRLLDPFTPLHPETDSEQYINFYDDKIRRIKFDITESQVPHHTVYVTGQSGTGKTTALLFMPDAEMNKKFEIVHLMADDLFDLNDIDIIDVLLRVAFTLTRDRPKLEKKYKDELGKIKKKIENKLTEDVETATNTKGEAKAALKVGVSEGFSLTLPQVLKFIGVNPEFSASLARDKAIRKVTREIFNFNKEDLKELVNKIIHELETEIAPRKVLLMIHNLERMGSMEQISNLFVANRQYLEQMKCRKIISTPVVLTNRPTFHGETFVFNIKLDTHPTTPNEGLESIEKNKERLRQVIKTRMAEDAQLIEEEAIEKAIELSGGIIRQFIIILRNAARHVAIYNEGGIITEDDVIEGANDFIRNVLVSFKLVIREKRDILQQIVSNPDLDVEGEEEQQLLELVQGTQVVVRQNDKSWYIVNPLVRKNIDLDDRN